ncbi:MAG: S-layer homology domain-containing protein [Clostridiales bacterium]|nr:S-layer homology domain-containing protein [Clostridiales bacterium]
MKKTFVAIFSAAAMVVSCLGGTSAYAASVFADINDVPWSGAATYIERAYELGLMEGYVENNLRYCKANNNITYCEATQLMYALMSSYSGTSVSDTVVTKWSTVMQSNNIPSWAYNAVAYALENSILSQTDISIFMSSSSTQNNARREDVAVIFGKALAKIYSLSSDASLSYNDASSIANTSVPYVELLNRLGIMVGDSDNNFNPKVNINRAEMSVLVVNTYDVLNGSSSTTTTTTTTTTATGTVTQYAGTITGITSSGSGYSITVSNDGTTNSFTTTSSTTVSGDSTSTVSGLSTGDSIVAVCYSGVATTIVLLSTGSSTSTAASTVKGTLNNVTTSTISIKTSSTTKSYSIYSSSIDVTIDSSSSSLSTLVSRFNGGYNYTVTLSLDSDSNVIGITATTGTSDSDYDDDAIVKLTSSKVTLNDGTVLYFPDDEDDVTIKLDGSTVDYDDLKDAFDDLDDDEQLVVASYSLNSDDELKKLTVTTEDLDSSSSSSSDEAEGLVKSISSSKITLTNGDKYSFADEDDITSLKIDSKSYSSLSKFVSKIDDALDDDEAVYVELTLDDDEIIKVVATTGEADEGDLDDIDTSDKEITVDGNTYDYTSSTTVSVIDGETTITSMSKLEKALNDDDKEIEVIVILDDDEVVSVTGYVTSVTGTLKSISSKTLTLDDMETTSKYKTTSDTDFTGDYTSLSKLKSGLEDYDITVTITLEDGEVTKVKSVED